MKRYFVFSVIVVLLGGSLLMVKGEAREAVPEADIKAVVAGNSEFAFDLYAKLKNEPKVKEAGGNLFFSPYSISTALAMTYSGARGRTAEQMAQTLKFPATKTMEHLEGIPNVPRPWVEINVPWEQGRLASAFGTLEKNLKARPSDRGYELNVANALWGQKGYGFLESFLEFNKKYFGAGLNEVDFFAQTEKARKTINTWIEKQTKDKIKELIRQGDLKRLTTLVLTNAIYFKGDWASKFKEENTKSAIFYVTEEKSAEVSMMYQKGKFAYSDGEDAQTLLLPYKGDELSMLIVLPKKISLLASIEKELTTENLAVELARLRKQEVAVYLPKFKITSGAFELKPVLKAMGMQDAFLLPPADFSGMTGTKDLFISHVLHKAFVEVNEEGTEAAAATAVIMNRKSLPRPTPVFRADHPFLFMIKDNRSGSILFMGKVSNPAKQAK